MPSPKGSPWFATPRRKRKRKPLSVTLSDEERAALERIARESGEKKLSRVVATAIVILAAMSQGQRAALLLTAASRGPTNVVAAQRAPGRRQDDELATAKRRR